MSWTLALLLPSHSCGRTVTVTCAVIEMLCRHEVKYSGEAAAGRSQKGEASGSKELDAHLLQNNNFWYKELNFGVQEEIKIKF